MHFVFGDTVNFTTLTWEAVATLLTGLAAVIGAIGLGKGQLRLQQKTLRLSMFERRYRIYRAACRWVGFILTEGKIPNRTGSASADAIERERAFLDAIDESRFVFAPHVFRALEKLWREGNALHYHQASSARAVQRERERHIDEEKRILEWFGQTSVRMAETFGDELKVSDGGETTFTPLVSAEDAEKAAAEKGLGGTV